MADIIVTPTELEAGGNDLKNLSTEVTDVLDDVKREIERMAETWDGLAADAYFGLYIDYSESLKQFPLIVESLGEATIKAAESFSDVDGQIADSIGN